MIWDPPVLRQTSWSEPPKPETLSRYVVAVQGFISGGGVVYTSSPLTSTHSLCRLRGCAPYFSAAVQSSLELGQLRVGSHWFWCWSEVCLRKRHSAKRNSMLFCFCFFCWSGGHPVQQTWRQCFLQLVSSGHNEQPALVPHIYSISLFSAALLKYRVIAKLERGPHRKWKQIDFTIFIF